MIREVPGRRPRIDPDTYIDPQAAVIGDVTIGAGSSVWPFAVLRGDQDNYVTLGRNSNVQDGSVLHVRPEVPCVVGDFVTMGHRAVLPWTEDGIASRRSVPDAATGVVVAGGLYGQEGPEGKIN